MKEYQKPSVELILLSAREELANQGAEGVPGTTSNPFQRTYEEDEQF